MRPDRLARLEERVAPGRLEIVSRTEEEARQATAIVWAAWSRAPRHAQFVDFAGGRAYFKLSALVGKTRLRHALKRGLLRAPLPRLAEFANLAWLREHGFKAPEPLAAGALWRRGLPRFQFLLTREVAGARTLETFLAEETEPSGRDERAAVLEELASTVARMHELRFLHHDLFPRNVLVTGASPSSGDGRVWFLDCWAGGPPPQARGPAYDLACLTLNVDGSLSPEEKTRILDTYTSARRAQDRGFDLDRFRRSVARGRDALARKIASP